MLKYFIAILILLFSSSAFSTANIIPESEILQFIKNNLQFPYPELALAIIRIESSANSHAQVYDGGCKCSTYGMMQIQLGTARTMGFTGAPAQLLDWKTNVTYGVRYLRSKLDEYGTVPDAVSAYNAGRALVRWPRSPSLLRYTNNEYVRNVLAELGRIMIEQKRMTKPEVEPFILDLVPATS